MQGFNEELTLLHPDPLVLELNRLQNQLKDKDRHLEVAQNEIKALRGTEALKDKALDELQNEVEKLDEKVRVIEAHLEQKNLEIKKLTDEKKEALAAQYAAEATLRRVYTNQKDDDCFRVETVVAPLEAQIKICKTEIAALQEDNKALDRLTKSKEAALLEAERILRSALERALIVEEVQNQNFELKRQIEICQEENKILEKTNRQKVLEVEKLTETIRELEEAILAGGAAANTIRDYKRQISELNEEKRTLERELSRVKVNVNRVATVVANEWKDENDRVMPIKQWLEERRILQAEMQRLREKLAISERTAKAEAQLKDKLKLRLKTLEDGFKHVPSFSTTPNMFCKSPKTEKSNHFFGILSSNSGLKKRSTSQPRGSSVTKISDHPNEPKNKEILLRKSLWASRSKVVDSGEKENHADTKENSIGDAADGSIVNGTEIQGTMNKSDDFDGEDVVSGFLYDKLQKEVLSLRKSSDAKDSTLNAKDEQIKILMKNIETLSKALEVESKKIKREAAIREKDSILSKVDDNNKKTKSTSSLKRTTKAP